MPIIIPPMRRPTTSDRNAQTNFPTILPHDTKMNIFAALVAGIFSTRTNKVGPHRTKP